MIMLTDIAVSNGLRKIFSGKSYSDSVHITKYFNTVFPDPTSAEKITTSICGKTKASIPTLKSENAEHTSGFKITDLLASLLQPDQCHNKAAPLSESVEIDYVGLHFKIR